MLRHEARALRMGNGVGVGLILPVGSYFDLVGNHQSSLCHCLTSMNSDGTPRGRGRAIWVKVEKKPSNDRGLR